MPDIHENWNDWEYQPSESELQEMFELTRRPGFFIGKADPENALKNSWLGGEPTLPDRYEWPRVWLGDHDFDPDYPEGPEPYPMHFLGQFDLSEFEYIGQETSLPKTGTLFFFRDAIYIEDYSLYRREKNDDDPFTGTEMVIYVEEGVSQCPPRRMPELTVDPRDVLQPYSGFIRQPTNGYQKQLIKIEPFMSNRTMDFHNAAFRDAVFQKCWPIEESWSERNQNSFGNFSRHNLLGSNYTKEPKEPVTLLLSLDSDREIGFDFPALRVAFYIRHQDIVARDFKQSFSVSEGR